MQKRGILEFLICSAILDGSFGARCACFSSWLLANFRLLNSVVLYFCPSKKSFFWLYPFMLGAGAFPRWQQQAQKQHTKKTLEKKAER
jgi:hypothetical protein